MPDYEALMVDWPALTPFSNVFDVGAFEGAWAAKIARKYHPRLWLFEPQTEGAHMERLRAGLEGENYRLFGVALGERNAELPMGEWSTDGCSFLLTEADAMKPGNSRQQMGRGVMVDASWWFKMYAVELPNIDLASINIEGYEFRLLPYLCETGDIRRFERLAVQFHLFVPDAYAQYAAIRERLEATHRLLWDAFPTWVAWERLPGVGVGDGA